MFPHGVSAYVDLMQDLIPEMKDGTVRTAIDTGCGVSPTFNSISCSLQQTMLSIHLSPIMPSLHLEEILIVYIQQIF